MTKQMENHYRAQYALYCMINRYEKKNILSFDEWLKQEKGAD